MAVVSGALMLRWSRMYVLRVHRVNEVTVTLHGACAVWIYPRWGDCWVVLFLACRFVLHSVASWAAEGNGSEVGRGAEGVGKRDRTKHRHIRRGRRGVGSVSVRAAPE